MKKAVFTALSIGLLCPMQLLAWGKEGHQMIAELAYAMLRPETKQTVKKHLGGIGIADAGTWMDDVRTTPGYGHMRDWHYINLEKGERYYYDDRENVVNEVYHAIEALYHCEDLSPEEIQLNLLVLFHLTGDIAQPLHTGYGSDKGGNDIELRFITRKSNLHKVWDSEIIKHKKISKDELAALYEDMSDEEVAAAQEVEPYEWMKQSRQLLRRVYNFEDNFISKEYADRNASVVKEQLVFASIRLAATLELLFGG